ncbi:MAG: hypothetical protein P8123_00580 [bacterium]|jgi:hypothetical protein
MKKRFLYVLLVLSFLLPPGCAELRTTVQIMNVALIELFRLPIYILRIPFQLMQHIGPMLQAGIRSAANMAPLLLFIERQAPKDILYAETITPGITDGDARAILSVIDREIADGAPVRFTLVDARLLEDNRLRGALFGALGEDGREVRCVVVDAGDIFIHKDRFLQTCSRMRARGDSLFALTAFNDDLAMLVDAASGDLPPAPADHGAIARWERMIEKIATDEMQREK